MGLNLIVYIVLALLLLIDSQTLHLISKLGLAKGPYVAIFLFVLFLMMLYSAIRSGITKGNSYENIKRGTFIFCFGVGVVWGVLMSFAAGFPHVSGLLDILLMILGYLLVGLLYVAIGYFFLQCLWKMFMKDENLK
jgi:hypothetical protein